MVGNGGREPVSRTRNIPDISSAGKHQSLRPVPVPRVNQAVGVGLQCSVTRGQGRKCINLLPVHHFRLDINIDEKFSTSLEVSNKYLFTCSPACSPSPALIIVDQVDRLKNCKWGSYETTHWDMEEGARKSKGQKKLQVRRAREMYERRPLKTVNLSPPDYNINPQILIESFVEKDIRFAGIIPDVPIALDSTNRTDVLRVIDRGKREGRIPCPVGYEHDAIFCLSIHNIKLSRRDGKEEVLLRMPIHEIAATCYIQDDSQHILAIKYGSYDELEDTCNMAVLFSDTRESSEELCSLIGQCFELVYTEATMQFFIRNARETNSSINTSSSSNFTTTTRSENSNSNRSTPITTPNTGRNFFDHSHMSFISQSHQNLQQPLAPSTLSSASRSLPTSRRKTSTPSENELLQQYMSNLHSKLNPSELKQFALLLKASYNNLPFKDFCVQVFELYGPDRKYLLAGLQPFIPEKDSAYFESFLERIGVTADSSPSSDRSNRNRRTMSGNSSSYSQNGTRDEYDRQLNDISGDITVLGASVDINTDPKDFLPL